MIFRSQEFVDDAIERNINRAAASGQFLKVERQVEPWFA